MRGRSLSQPLSRASHAVCGPAAGCRLSVRLLHACGPVWQMARCTIRSSHLPLLSFSPSSFVRCVDLRLCHQPPRLPIGSDRTSDWRRCQCQRQFQRGCRCRSHAVHAAAVRPSGQLILLPMLTRVARSFARDGLCCSATILFPFLLLFLFVFFHSKHRDAP